MKYTIVFIATMLCVFVGCDMQMQGNMINDNNTGGPLAPDIMAQPQSGPIIGTWIRFIPESERGNSISFFGECRTYEASGRVVTRNVTATGECSEGGMSPNSQITGSFFAVIENSTIQTCMEFANEFRNGVICENFNYLVSNTNNTLTLLNSSTPTTFTRYTGSFVPFDSTAPMLSNISVSSNALEITLTFNEAISIISSTASVATIRTSGTNTSHTLQSNRMDNATTITLVLANALPAGTYELTFFPSDVFDNQGNRDFSSGSQTMQFTVGN